MNPRTFCDDEKYYALEPPWFFASHHVFERLFQLKRNFNHLRHSLDKLDTLYQSCESQGTDAISSHFDIAQHVSDLMESSEVLMYNFQELAEATWFGGFRQDVAHTYWRIEDGRFDEAHRDEEVLARLLGEVKNILSNTSESTNQGVVNHLNEFFSLHARDISPQNVPDDFSTDVYEARDLYCLGYYSTALLVLGRAVEKALVKLGEARRVESIHVYGETKPWTDAKFHFRNNALSEIDFPGRHGKVLTKKQYHQIAILVDYRNNVAHSEYENIGREETHRQIRDAFDLLKTLTEKIEYLHEIDDEEIEPVVGQKAQ